MTIQSGLHLIKVTEINSTDVLSRHENGLRIVLLEGISNHSFFDVKHISGDYYHIYSHHRAYILASGSGGEEFRQTPAWESSDQAKWRFHHHGQSPTGFEIYSVRNKSTGDYLFHSRLEFMPAHKYITFLITKRHLLARDYRGRMEALQASIQKSNATGIPLANYVSKLAEVGLENLDDIHFGR
ncbi:hypothetical protein BDW75DRAFT_226175 [Aspergillus navahoensis]